MFNSLSVSPLNRAAFLCATVCFHLQDKSPSVRIAFAREVAARRRATLTVVTDSPVRRCCGVAGLSALPESRRSRRTGSSRSTRSSLFAPFHQARNFIKGFSRCRLSQRSQFFLIVPRAAFLPCARDCEISHSSRRGGCRNRRTLEVRCLHTRVFLKRLQSSRHRV